MLIEPTDPLVLLEPGAVKAARRVLGGPRHSNVPGLPDHIGTDLAGRQRPAAGHVGWPRLTDWVKLQSGSLALRHCLAAAQRPRVGAAVFGELDRGANALVP